MTTKLTHDFADPLIISLLLCDSAQLLPGDERNATAIALERWLRTRGAVSGDFEKLSIFARGLDSNLGALPREIFEAAMHLHARATRIDHLVGSGLAPSHLRGLSLARIAGYVLSWEGTHAKPRAKKRASKARAKSSRRRAR